MPKRGTTKFNSDLQEKRVANELHAKQVIASGALWFAKADVENDDLLVECKTTSKEYYPLKAATWDKIDYEAKQLGKIPIMCIDIYHYTGIKTPGANRLSFAVFNLCDIISTEPKKTILKIIHGYSFRINSSYEGELYKVDISYKDKKYLLGVCLFEEFLELYKELKNFGNEGDS